MQDEEVTEVNQTEEFISSIGFDQAERGSHLSLLASDDEKKYYKWLLGVLPNVTNIDIIALTNLACLLSQFKKLNKFISLIDDNIELFLKLISKRSETITKIDMVLKSYGLLGTNRDKHILAYDLTELEQ